MMHDLLNAMYLIKVLSNKNERYTSSDRHRFLIKKLKNNTNKMTQ